MSFRSHTRLCTLDYSRTALAYDLKASRCTLRSSIAPKAEGVSSENAFRFESRVG